MARAPGLAAGAGRGGAGGRGGARAAGAGPPQPPAARGVAGAGAAAGAAAAGGSGLQQPGVGRQQVSSVYKFGGSSVRDAERMREVAEISCGFPEEAPCVVLSAMGKTTNNLLAAGWVAAERAGEAIRDPQLVPAVAAVLELHRATMDELGTDAEARQEVEDLLDQFQQVVCSVAILGDLSPRVQDTLVSFPRGLRSPRMAT